MHLYVQVLLLLLLVACGGNGMSAQNYNQTARVSFIIKAKTGTAGGAVFLTGNHPALGHYDPGALQMFPAEENSWIATLKFNVGTVVDVRFSRGSSETEAVDRTGNPYGISFLVNRDTIVYHSIENWEDRGSINRIATLEEYDFDKTTAPEKVAPKPKPKVFVKLHTNLSAANVSPRNIRVFLPPSYYDNPSWHYPVLYVLDGMQHHFGRNEFMGSRWNVGETAKEMMKNGEIEEVIVVVIDNSSDLFMPYFSRELYASFHVFMGSHVKPFMVRNYRVREDAMSHTIMGGSRAGLLACAVSWKLPNEFAKVIAFSPRVEFARSYYSFVSEIKSSREYRSVHWYLDAFNKEREARLLEGVESLYRNLLEKGVAVQYQESYDFGDHATNVKERIRAALQFQY